MLQIISSKKIEIEHGKFSGGKSSERIRNKRLRGSTTLSAVTAALRDEESETDDQDDTMDDDVCEVIIFQNKPKKQAFCVFSQNK